MSSVNPAASLAIPVTVADLIHLFLTSGNRVSPHVARERRRVLDWFAADRGTLLLADLKAFHLQLWMNARASWRTDWQRKRVAGVIKRVWNWAEDLEIVDRNPFRRVKLPSGDSRLPMDLGVYRGLLKRASADERRQLVFLRFSGCRPGELRSIEWPQVRWPEGLIRLEKHKTRHRTRRARLIYLHPTLVKLLQWMKRHRLNQDVKTIFNAPNGSGWNRRYWHMHFQWLRERAGFTEGEAQPYGLRHLFGTQAILSGLDLKTLAELLGHTSTKMAEHYVHLAKASPHLLAALKKMFGGTALFSAFPRL